MAKLPATFLLATRTTQESNSTHLADFKLGRAPLRDGDVPPERPGPVLLPLRLLAALPVLVPPCTKNAHCIKPEREIGHGQHRSGSEVPLLTPGVGAALVIHCEAMPPADSRLDDPDSSEGVDEARVALRLGLRRVSERPALVPPPREELRAARGSPEQNGSERELRAERLAPGGGDDGQRRLRAHRHVFFFFFQFFYLIFFLM